MFALVSLCLSVTLHSWAHGGTPAPAGMVAGAGLMLGLGTLLGNRRRGFVVIVGALGVAQAVLHVVFSVSSAGGHVMAPPHSPAAMLGAHLVAGALTACWLYAGEVAIWRVAGWLARRVPSLGALFALLRLAVPAPAPRLTPWRLAERPVAVPDPPWRRSVVRRGPPVRSL